MYKSFQDFEKMYGMNSTNDEKSNNDIFPSQFEQLDQNDNDDVLYNELAPSNTYDIEDTAQFEASIFEQILGNTPPTRPIETNPNLEDTMEIDTFELDEEINEILKPKEIKKNVPKKKKWLPMTVANDHHLEYAFAHCAILAFITAAMGTGFLTYLINHI